MNTARIVALGAAACTFALIVYATLRVEEPFWRYALPILILVYVVALFSVAADGRGSLRVGGAMFRKSLLQYRSYRMQLVSTFVYVGLSVALLYVAAGPIFRTLFDLDPSKSVPRDIVAYLAIGLVTWPLFWKSWEVTTLGVRGEQWEGTLEAIIPTPYGTRVLPFGYLMMRVPYTLLFAIMSLTAIALALPGTLLMFTTRGLLEFVAVLALGVAIMWGLGLLFGGLAILYKQLGPADLVVRTLFTFLAGVFVPVEIFPTWAQNVAEILPLTHAYRLLHAIAADGIPIGEFATSLLILVALASLAVGVGTFVYRSYVEKARRQGVIQGY